MNELERRLYHAARELRAIDIEPPPLVAVSSTRRTAGLAARVPALVMPVLFVIGGLAVVVGGLGRTAESPEALTAPPSVVSDAGERVEPEAPSVTAARRPLTAHQEVALIATLAPTQAAPDDVVDPPVDVDAPVRSFSPSYR